jgi:hypothetical protein
MKEEHFEIYCDGEYQYFQPEAKEFLSWGDLYSLYYANGGSMSQEHAMAMLGLMDEPEQLDDEVIDGVTCLHYIGNLKIGMATYAEIWIGKDDYLIRQIKQVVQSEKYIETYITRYYNFNADITIALPLDNAGNLLSGWEKEVYELGFDVIPVEDAIASITGNEDWSDPYVIREVMELFIYSSDPIIFFNALPEEGQQAIINYLENMSSNMTVVTSTIVVGLNYDEGILHYTNSSAEMDIYIYTGVITDEEGIVHLSIVETIESWVNIILASDPQSYFDALPVEKQQSLTVALNDDSILGTIMHELSLALAN